MVQTHWEEAGSFFNAICRIKRELVLISSILLAEWCFETQGIDSSQILDGIENEIKTGQRFCNFVFGE